MRDVWQELLDAVGAFDATSHMINRSVNEKQADYHSAHQHYYCIHTQIVLQNNFAIRHNSSVF